MLAKPSKCKIKNNEILHWTNEWCSYRFQHFLQMCVKEFVCAHVLSQMCCSAQCSDEVSPESEKFVSCNRKSSTSRLSFLQNFLQLLKLRPRSQNYAVEHLVNAIKVQAVEYISLDYVNPKQSVPRNKYFLVFIVLLFFLISNNYVVSQRAVYLQSDFLTLFIDKKSKVMPLERLYFLKH